MRTTISISDPILKEVKRAALERRCTIGEVVEDALRVALVASKKRRRREAVQGFRTFGKGGIQAGIDLNSNAAVLDAMEDR